MIVKEINTLDNKEINVSDKRKEIGLKIKDLRKKRGLSQLDLANLINSSQSHIANIEAGRRRLSFETLEKIAAALGVSVAELLSTPEEKKKKTEEILEEITNLVLLPVYADVPASGFRGGDVEIIDYLPTPREMLRGVPQNRVAWVKVVGDSMKPKVERGDLVLVADGTYTEIKNGDLVIAVLDGETTLKRFYDKGEFIFLQPENEKYEPIIIKKEKLKEKPLHLYKVLGVFKRY